VCQNKTGICHCPVASPIELFIARWLHRKLWLTSYWIGMRLSFKSNVTCRPTWNLWFVNVLSTCTDVKTAWQKNWQLVGSPLEAEGTSHGTTGTVVKPALSTPFSWELCLDNFAYNIFPVKDSFETRTRFVWPAADPESCGRY